MLVTRKTKIPVHWVFYAQVPFVMAIAANYATGAPFIYAIKKFLDNPAAITFLLSIEVFVTVLLGPFCSWLSDRVWTRWGRRKLFIIVSNVPQATALILMPFAPDLWWLLALRWIYGIFGEIGTPNQALTMEVVPARQRGLGSGFFTAQINLVNLVFWGVVFGRLDDVYFTGPFFSFAAGVSGEMLVFISGGILLLAICFFTFYGMHEVEPPNRQRIAEERRPGESMLRLFFRSFFREVLGKELLPLYLLLVVGTLANVGLGILGPLLFTEQWGFTKQELGTNIAIGAAYGIILSIFSGWIADRTSKLAVYTVALALGTVAKIAWTLYVFQLPGHRPSLLEALVFGNIQFTFSTLAGVVSFPLILEYVERNRLGTAGAGMGLFNGLIKNAFTMFVGVYLLWWSIFFLPQAGDRVRVVFSDPVPAAALASPLAEAGLAPEQLHVEAVHRPGVEAATSRHWQIRRSIADAGDQHKRLKQLDNTIGRLETKAASPLAKPDAVAALRTEIAALRDERTALRATLDASARDFEARLTSALATRLAAPGSHLRAATLEPDGGTLSLTLAIAEPLSGPLTTEEARALGTLPTALDTLDLARLPADDEGQRYPDLAIEPVPGPDSQIILRVRRDPAFVALELALARANLPPAATFNVLGDLTVVLRAFAGPEPRHYQVAEASATVTAPDQPVALDFVLNLAPDAGIVIPGAEAIAASFRELPSLRGAEAAPLGEQRFRVSLQLSPLTPAPLPADAIATRLGVLLPEADPALLASLHGFHTRVEATLAARPFFFHTTRPVTLSEAADRQYDYFFSMQYFMIITDFFGFGVIGLILYLERRGLVRRRGAEEDQKRLAPSA